MKKIKIRLNYLTAGAMLFLGGLIAKAQTQDPAQILNAGIKGLANNAKPFLLTMTLLTLISGAVSVFWAMIDRKNSQEGGNQRVMSTGIALLIAFIVFLVLYLAANAIGTNIQFQSTGA